ncbi:cell wall-binding repeat-containing protein [Metabacillus idriensis]|uniref:cell wall-binding repeat-containing protein n=1 Tax=Metabacillus idriensis TaxID=324768 RepID=UPI003D266C4E
MFNSKKMYRALGTILLGAMVLPVITVQAAETLSPPKTPSKTEVIQKWEELDKVRYSDSTPYEEKPSIIAPYKAGVLNGQYIEQGIRTANFYRYMSGLPMNLADDQVLNNLAQHGAVLSAKNGYISHSPPKPADMPSSFYSNAAFSSSTSNLAMLSWNPAINMLSHTVDKYMEDFNVESAGHRMWILSPYVSAVGFGLAADENQQAGYSDMNVFGYRLPAASYSPFDYFAYPSNGDYPKEYFKADYAWSIGIDQNLHTLLGDLEQLKVTLTRKSDNKKWEFPYSSDRLKIGNGAGKLNTLIFRPQLDYIKDGEEFTVDVTGIKDLYGNSYSISHKTGFFDLIEDRAYGVVADAETNKPLSGAAVEFHRVTPTGNSLYRTLSTNSIGEYDYTGFPLGEYELVIKKEGYAKTSFSGIQIENEADRFDDYLGKIDLDRYSDQVPPDVPKVNAITDKSASVTGTAEAGTLITVKKGTAVLGKAGADAQGRYSVQIPKQAAGTVILVTATDDEGNESPAVRVTVTDATAPAAPAVNSLTDLDNRITGTAEKSATIIAKTAGKEIGRSVANASGQFQIAINKQTAGSTIELSATDAAGNKSAAITIQVADQMPLTEKLIGSNRYDTAVKISNAGWETSNTVFLVNGWAIADGLTATPLASVHSAPVLLAAKDSIPASTIEEIKRLKAKKIVIIGGTGVISLNVEKDLVSKGLNVVRIGGKNRYDTSLIIAQELDKLSDVHTAYFAYGFGEPDALSVAAQAGQTKQPIILTKKTEVPANIYKWLQEERLQNAYFIGGTSVVSAEIMKEVNEITDKDVLNNRLSGSNRQETNAKVINAFYKQTDLPTIMAAHSNTDKLVDALAAGPLAAKWNVPVLLVSDTGLHHTQISAIEGVQTAKVHQIGGGIDAAILDQLVELMN